MFHTIYAMVSMGLISIDLNHKRKEKTTKDQWRFGSWFHFSQKRLNTLIFDPFYISCEGYLVFMILTHGKTLIYFQYEQGELTSFLCSQWLIDGKIDIADKTCNITAFLILLNNIGDTVFYWSILSKRKDYDRFVMVDWTAGISHLLLLPNEPIVSTTRSFIVVEMCRKIKKRLISYPKFYSLKIIHIYEYLNQSLAMATIMLMTSWEWLF